MQRKQLSELLEDLLDALLKVSAILAADWGLHTALHFGHWFQVLVVVGMAVAQHCAV